MKIFFDLFPIVLFFIAYKMRDIYFATGVIIVACFAQLVLFWFKNRRFEKVHVWTFVTVLVLGGATLALKDPVFIKWKPTIVNWGLGIVFLISAYVGEKPLVQRMLGSALEMPKAIWGRLNLAWVAFFVFCGGANLYVAYTWTENAWVNFKLFGLTACSIVFMVAQMLVLKAYIQPEEAEAVATVE